MRNLHPKLRLPLLFLAAASLGGLGVLIAARASTRADLEAAMVLARDGVVQNSNWLPVTRHLDGLEFALVPAGCFTMGSTDSQLALALDFCERFFGRGNCQVDFKSSETPAHEVCFDQPFWIQVTEVSNRAYGASSSVDMYRNLSWPRETVTWYQASEFCQRHKARLPSGEEWEYAARGPDSVVFPWGDDFDLENVISGRLVPAEVGSIPSGSSWVGALDMSGGMAEWVEEPYIPYGQGPTAPGAPEATGQRVLRGGSWFSFSPYMLRSAHREAADPDTANSTIGFRCARDTDLPQ